MNIAVVVSWRVLTILAVVASMGVGSGQSTVPPGRGFSPSGSYNVTESESVNTVNGNLIYSVPLVSLPPGRAGHTASIGLFYNSQIYDIALDFSTFAQGGGLPVGTPLLTSRLATSTSGGGWQYSFNYGLELSRRPQPAPDGTCDGIDSTIWRTFKLTLLTPDGGRRILIPRGYQNDLGDGYYEITPGGNKSGCAPNQTPFTGTMHYFTTDGTFINVQIPANPSIPWTNQLWTIRMPDGHRVTGYADQTEHIYDRNNNEIRVVRTDVAGQNPTTRLEDAAGRSISIEYVSNSGRNSSTVDYVRRQAYGGAPDLTWAVNWGEITVGPFSYPCNAEQGVCTEAVGHRTVTSIVVPNITGNQTLSYVFGYDSGTASQGGYGELNDVTTPSGQRVLYQYKYQRQTLGVPERDLQTLAENPIREKELRWNDENATPVAQQTETWSYTFNPTSSTIVGPCVQLPCTAGSARTVSNHFYAAGGLSDRRRGLTYKTVQSNGDTVEREWVSNRPISIPDQDPGNPYVRFEYRSVTNPGGTLVNTSARSRSFDKNGNLVSDAEYDWVTWSALTRDSFGVPTGFPGSPVRTINLTYNAPTATAGTGTGVVSDEANAYWNLSSAQTRNAIASKLIQEGNAVRAAFEYQYDAPLTTANLTFDRAWDSNKAAVYVSPLTGSNGIFRQYVYDLFGNRTAEFDSNTPAGQTVYTYGTVCGIADLYPTQITAELNTVTNKVFDCATGVENSSVEQGNNPSENIATIKTYDALGRITLLREAAGTAWERQTQTEYSDFARRIIVRRDRDALADQQLVSVQHFDQLGRLRLTQELENAASQSATDPTAGIKVQTRYRYEGTNRYELVSNPYRCATLPCSETTMGWARAKYDSVDRTIERRSFSGSALPGPWPDNSTATTGGVSNVYDGFYVVYTDEDGRQQRKSKDGLGRLVEVTDGFSSLNLLTTYTYDILNNLRTVLQNGQTRIFEYDSLSRLVRAQNPESGSTCFGQLVGDVCQARYDGNSNLRFKTDTRRAVTEFTYDRLNRLIGKAYTVTGTVAPTDPVTYIYSAATTSWSKNRLTSVGNPTSTMAYTSYDALGRVTSSTESIQGNSYSFGTSLANPGYTYNREGTLASIKYPSGRTVMCGTDAAGRVQSVTGTRGSAITNYVTSATYSAFGAVAGADFNNGLREAWTFNDRGQVGQIGVTKISNGSVLLSLGFGWGTTNNNGNLRAQSISGPGISLSQSFGYDAANRLQTATEAGAWSQTYSYDAAGNRWVSASAGVAVSPFTPVQQTWFNAQNQIVGETFDAAGYQSSMGGYGFTYDAEGLMVTSAINGFTVSYTYDGLGRRVRKQHGGRITNFVYDAMGRLAAEYATPTPSGPSGFQLMSMDHLGSTRLITDAAGAEIERRDYLPFGEQIEAGVGGRAGSYTANLEIKQKFTGKERDAETGLDYFGARYMSAAQGRFTSPDAPFADQHVEDPQSWNLYSYVRNNPLSHIDPTGQACFALNRGSAFCGRATEYGEIDSRVSGKTRFFAAASAVSQFLANTDVLYGGLGSRLFVSGVSQTFLSGVGSDLLQMNRSAAADIQSGKLSGPDLDARMVNMEQTRVQQSLDALKKSDPAAYDQVVEDSNSGLNPSGLRKDAATRFSTDKAYMKVIDGVRNGLGRDIDFRRQADREAIGNALIRHIRQSGGCDIAGEKLQGCR